MKSLFIAFCFCIAVLSSFGQTKKTSVAVADPNKKIELVETACGECQFKMKGKSCDLAVRINGKSYFVDGTNINDHGDAHATEGFCNAISKAEVQGTVVNNRFKVTYFKLLPAESKKD
jgi:hypothetical protein